MLNGEKISNEMVAFKNAVAVKDNGGRQSIYIDYQCPKWSTATRQQSVKNVTQENENTRQFMP